MTTTQTPVDALMALVDRYWELAYAEGKEGRDHDTEAGEAQAVLSEIRASVRALAAIPEQQAGGVPAGFVLVPVELTEAMEDAGEAHIYAPTYRSDLDRIWAAMLSASPSPSAVQPLSEAQREPLTDEQIIYLTDEIPMDKGGFVLRIARAIESAHGIVTKEST